MGFLADNDQRALDSYRPMTVDAGQDLGARLAEMEAEVRAKMGFAKKEPRASAGAPAAPDRPAAAAAGHGTIRLRKPSR